MPVLRLKANSGPVREHQTVPEPVDSHSVARGHLVGFLGGLQFFLDVGHVDAGVLDPLDDERHDVVHVAVAPAELDRHVGGDKVEARVEARAEAFLLGELAEVREEFLRRRVVLTS